MLYGGDRTLFTCRELHGAEYTLDSCQEPHLFVVCKQIRKAADLAAPQMFFYILDGSIYQTPTIHAAFSARLVSSPLQRCFHTWHDQQIQRHDMQSTVS